MDEKDENRKWMYKLEIFYNEQQKPIIDRFIEYCRVHGYNRVAGLDTYHRFSEYHKHMQVMADRILDLNKEIVYLKELIETPVEAPNEPERPKTMGEKDNTPEDEKVSPRAS